MIERPSMMWCFSVSYYTVMSHPPEVKRITQKVTNKNIRKYLSNMVQVLVFRISGDFTQLRTNKK